MEIEDKLRELEARGVQIIDRRQVFIAPEVKLERIFPGAVLFPGTRLLGEKTLVGSGAKIGTEGPAVISNTILGANTEVKSGFLDGAVLLEGAKAGANAHFRAGTLLEEEASTAHAVGLKQTILMAGVTLGSLINLCDILVSGGRSREEHTEIGSGFVHFNFTPYGKHGDKATPTLVGDVENGVFLDTEPIFLGGMSGIVGPAKIGFGAMTVAGQVIRKDVPAGIMSSEAGISLSKEFAKSSARPSEEHRMRKWELNREFLRQLFMLKGWYEGVRMPRASEEEKLVYEGAIEIIEGAIQERIKRYNSFAKEWGDKEILEDEFRTPDLTGVIDDLRPGMKYVDFVHSLSDEEKAKSRSIFRGI